jgi:hypothetical protein
VVKNEFARLMTSVRADKQIYMRSSAPTGSPLTQSSD